MRLLSTLSSPAVLLVALVACAGHSAPPPHQVAQPPTSPLVGHWQLLADRPPTTGPGLRIELQLDSVRADTVFGALTLMFSGNTGIDPARFRPFRGTVEGDSLLTIPIEPVEPDGPRLKFVGVVQGDRVTLREFRVGPDDFAAGATWYLVHAGEPTPDS